MIFEKMGKILKNLNKRGVMKMRKDDEFTNKELQEIIQKEINQMEELEDEMENDEEMKNIEKEVIEDLKIKYGNMSRNELIMKCTELAFKAFKMTRALNFFFIMAEEIGKEKVI